MNSMLLHINEGNLEYFNELENIIWTVKIYAKYL